ncbi:MAG: 2,3-bisphosphoglycerate-independent phosphoglycerate mutase [Candidatus Puniceispirillales bacterium]
MTSSPHPSSPQTPVVLAIMDGLGHRDGTQYNAVKQARTPVLDRLDRTVPKAFLNASEAAVGLPAGQVGNSEVGHMTIGAGRILKQDLVRIDDAIANDMFKTNPVLDAMADALSQNGAAVHILDMASDGGVHSHSDHILALTRAMCDRGIPVWLHLFTDGRDTMPGSATDHFNHFINACPASAKIATVTGRYYAMDRDHRWERTGLAFDAIAYARADHHYAEVNMAIAGAYARGESDEFFLPTIIGDYDGIAKGDAIIMANFRADRVRQLLDGFLFTDTPIDHPLPEGTISTAIAMTSYSEKLDAVCDLLFPPLTLTHTLGDVVAAAGLRQLRLAETEKYPHVTFFLNGGSEDCHPGEERCLIPSPKVATYDLQPEMSAEQVLSALLQAINSQSHDLIIVNFANPDMVGHTGDLEATIKAVETVDQALEKVISLLEACGGTMLLTADHGNCELMWDEDSNSPHTAHTTNPVPIYWIGAPPHGHIRDGGLSDLAPSLLDLLGVSVPDEMTGISLISYN